MSKKTITNGANERVVSYGYIVGGQGSGSTTPLVSKITQPGLTLEYEYDHVGNITKETRTDTSVTPNVVKEITYQYDKLGQLLRVNDQSDTTAGEDGTTWQYVYDLGGNILSKSCYVFTTGTLGAVIGTSTYAYGDANWKDKLTGYKIGTADELPITYDVIGNPLSYNGWTYTWEKGRQLKRMQNAEKLVEFAYDAAGLRTQKKVTEGTTETTTDYFLHGKLVMHQKVTKVVNNGTPEINELHFFYDAQSRPQMVSFDGILYTYVHNLQGDIVAILDKDGVKVVEYKYDAWGKPIGDPWSLTAEYQTLAGMNPFRYRRYLFDKETALYYLRTRYYIAMWDRFLNADTQLGKLGTVLAQNAFSYCSNKPTVSADPNGQESYVIPGDISDDYALYAAMVVFAAGKIGVSADRYTEILDEYEAEELSDPKLCNQVVSEIGRRAVGDSPIFRQNNILNMYAKFESGKVEDNRNGNSNNGNLDAEKRGWTEVKILLRLDCGQMGDFSQSHSGEILNQKMAIQGTAR